MSWNLPRAVSRALSLLCEAGYEAYIVGGCVRDTLMGVMPNDWDITTSALPEQTLAVFWDFRTIETGIQHGTVTVIIEDTPLEITTYRVDGTYSDNRRPDAVSFTPSLAEDLRRRDFTVNAMAYHPEKGLVDLFGGADDITNRRIICVGDPDTRFSEDALRIIRGLRFASTLGFSVEETTADAIRRLSPTLSNVAAERVTEELIKLLCGKDASSILTGFDIVFEGLLPGFIAAKAALLVKTVRPRPFERLAALLFPTVEKNADAILNTLRLPNRLKEDVKTVLSCRDIAIPADDASLLRILHRVGAERANVLLTIRSVWDDCDYTSQLARLNYLHKSGACYTMHGLAITGDDLIEAGVNPGPEIGKKLDELLFAVMDGVCENDKQALLNYIK